jgi:TRAP-type mannitol/chloroaromatic compound transport system substrate-binding protein
VLAEQLKVWDELIAKKSAENPLFKKVLDSQKAFAERAGKWQNDQNVDYTLAFNHYFGKKT